MTNTAFIYDALRTPRGRGKKDGGLHEVKPVSLLAGVLRELQRRNDLDTSRVDDVVMGVVSPVGEQGSVIPRTALMVADWAEPVAGVQINRFCASGLEAVNLGAQKVASGWEDLVVVGGVESMSRVPIGSDGGAWAADPQTNFHNRFVPQGVGADLIATLGGFTREDVDRFAMQSHHKAAAAWANGAFSKSIVPVKDINGFTILEKDELVRGDSSMETLGKLKPAFQAIGEMAFDDYALLKYPEVDRINHVHTPGNSSGIVDGATAMLIGNEKIGKELGLTPRGRIVATAVIGSEPTIMLTGPGPVTQKVLKKAGMTIDQIDLFEVNEAFASIVLRFMADTGAPLEKINVNGGAIAMGHPLGATGAILVGTVLDELERRKLRFGLCTLCVGAGMGIAAIVERV
jgi:acetyl-CoA C-acetyltransferase